MSPDAFALGLKALYSPPTDDAFRASGEIRLGDDVFAFDIESTGLEVRRGQGAARDFEVTGTITEIWNLVTGSAELAEAIQKGVVSITGDPTTPHAGAIRLADSLGSALLTVEGEGHTIVSAGANTCVDDIASAYLIDLRLPAPGATCPL